MNSKVRPVLKPSNRPIVKKVIWGFDTEDDSKGTVKQICATDGDKYFHFTKREKFIEWLYSYFNSPTVLICCNLEYDLINCFRPYMKLLNLRLKNAGLSIVSARLKESKVIFYDSLNHFMYGVAKMGERIGLKKLAMDLTGWDYVNRDAEIVCKYAQMMQDRYNEIGASFNATLPSSSLDLYRRNFLSFNVVQPDEHTLRALFTGYYGGRVEVFNTNPTFGQIYYIDVNSMYPYVMQRPYPNPNDYEFVDKINLDAFGIANVFVCIPTSCYFGPLAHRTEKLMFPVGKFSGTWTNYELRAMIERGGKILKIEWAIEFPNSCYPFRDFISNLYAKRIATNDPLEKEALKLFMNSLYGKTGEKMELVEFMAIEDLPPDRAAIVYGEFAFVECGEKFPNHSNAIWAIYTTAYARDYLLRSMENIRDNGGNVLYCDTDSIIYQSSKPLHDESQKLGGWKSEGNYEFAHFLQPKLYALRSSDKKEIYKAKGVPKDFAYRFFNEGSATYSRPFRLRQVLKRGLKGNIWFEQTKRRNARYDKRLVLDNGDTMPHILS